MEWTNPAGAVSLDARFSGGPPEDALGWFAGQFSEHVAFSTSFGPEDQVILHMIRKAGLPVRIFTLDTGRLFQETLDLMDLSVKKYGLPVRVLFPDASQVEDMVNARGINLFYESVENRKLCCHIRKIEPLKRALQGVRVWITGMRREQSVTRSGVPMVGWDDTHGLIKLNPLASWTQEQVSEYILREGVPVNELHAQGFPSIGCKPCTRAVPAGADPRSGRWWWELPENRECGLHTRDH